MTNCVQRGHLPLRSCNRKSLRLERSSGALRFNPCLRTTRKSMRLLRGHVVSLPGLNVSKGGDLTTSLGSLQCVTSLTLKKFFLIFGNDAGHGCKQPGLLGPALSDGLGW